MMAAPSLADTNRGHLWSCYTKGRSVLTVCTFFQSTTFAAEPQFGEETGKDPRLLENVCAEASFHGLNLVSLIDGGNEYSISRQRHSRLSNHARANRKTLHNSLPMMLAAVIPILFFSSVSACDSRGGSVCINIINNCPFTIWPGILGPGNPEGGGFRLDSQQSRDIHVPNKWTAGRIWARRDCDDNFNCATGFCGNKLQCSGAGGRPPASLAEFTLNGHGNQDYYDVSLVDGYNLPVFIEPLEGTYQSGGGEYECKRAGGCFKDLNDPNLCPKELREEKNGQIVGCKSACFAFNDPYFCCAGAFRTPDKCNAKNWPVNYAGIFKSACPTAYSYAYDDHTSTFTCRGNGSPSPAYKVQFC